ncbi:5-formyltetrahydrofolate cyclo-ligase [Levilactobacillus koreensis JCM 16448]|uniref:5-formyltetrahydrofolate cyclo-ligase n=1 Tax=Levilactobacillus koreensis TaxID=637971 RepID=A0AAC8UWT2_9LACO|nr:5-formyltetrahydrofolate cyclo-ligase [Levilactobacillus koreensis]AKP65931.1 5-formyltetrahydrofolate cyclo-ligase [Levilactobacillus koreensis]KRK90301.1 5-formyltetrahydrofolate cyclo-ligase [Levilactobacillus koreensis JCM 16448]
MATKKALRQQTIQALKTMSAEDRQVASEQLYQQLWALPEWQSASKIATTISSGFELATQPIIDQAHAAGKIVAVPQTLPHRQMAFHVADDHTNFERSKFGLLEPVDGEIIAPDQFDLIVVPGLIFAATRERLGFGGGYYDRYLPKTTGFKVALALPAQQASQPGWTVESFDVRLDAVLAAQL